MDAALSAGRQSILASRLDVLEYAASQNARQISSAAAMAKAVEATVRLSRVDSRTLRCLRKESGIYGKSMNSAAAMAKAFEACGDN